MVAFMDSPAYAPHADVLVTDLQTELVLLHTTSSEMYSLNEVARTIWTRLPATRAELLALLLERYEVAPTQAEQDLSALMADLQRLNMVQEH